MTYFFYICMSLDYSDILFFTSVCRWIIATYLFTSVCRWIIVTYFFASVCRWIIVTYVCAILMSLSGST